MSPRGIAAWESAFDKWLATYEQAAVVHAPGHPLLCAIDDVMASLHTNDIENYCRAVYAYTGVRRQFAAEVRT